MKYLFVSIILLFTYFQQIDPKSIRLWSRYGPRQGGWDSNGVLGISPWSGSGRFSGMMAAMGPSAMSGIGGNGVGQFGGLGRYLFLVLAASINYVIDDRSISME
jgi:hypothetical protein